MITPQAPNGVASTAVLPKLDPSVRFVFLHHRANWEVLVDSEGTTHLVPVVVAFRFQPGVAGVLQIGNGQAPHGDPSIALAQKAADGWIQIPEEPVRAWGELRPSYCVRYAGQKGSAHLEAWWKLSDLGGGRVEKEWDQDGWIEWKKSLVQRGLVAPISEPVRKALQADYAKSAQKRRVNPNHAVAIAHSEQYEQRARGCDGQAKPTPAAAEPAPTPAPISAPQPTEPPDWLAGLHGTIASLAGSLGALGDALRSMQEQQAALAARVDALPQSKLKKPELPAKPPPSLPPPPAPPPADPDPQSPLIED